jgi:hypothetical protein
MPTGLSGSNPGIGGDSIAELQLVELRAMNAQLLNLLGTTQAQDEVGMLRNDAAFALQIPVPLPGAGR